MPEDAKKPTAADLRTLRAEAVRKALDGDVTGALRLSGVHDLVQQDAEPEPDGE